MCAWATIDKLESVNFADIVFEEKLRNFQTRKENSALDVIKSLDQNITIKENGNTKDTSCSGLTNQGPKHLNNANEELQVPLLFDNNCQGVSLKQDYENYIHGETNDIQENENVDVSHPLENELISAASYGYKLRNSGKMIVKHDIVLIEKKNMSKSPPKFQIKKNFIEEDLFDLKLSYKFFKNLRIHFRTEENGNCEVRDKEKKVFDLILYGGSVLHDFITNGLLHSTYYVLNSGKRAVILYGTFGPSFSNTYGAIKYFKTTDPETKQCTESNCLSEEGAQREIKTNLWQAEKEMSNLMNASMAGVPCPQIIKLKMNVLVMSFIGEERKPAPKLKYAGLHKSSFVSAYEQVRHGMKRLYEKVNLVHGDLTENNILWHNGQCYFIDFSRSVEVSHENAFYILLTDCIKITRDVINMCAWATIEKPESASFADIVLEEKLRNLQTKKGNSALDVVRSLDQRTEERGYAEDTSGSDLSDHELKRSSNTSEYLQVPLWFERNCQGVSLSQDLKNNIQGEIRDIKDDEDLEVSHPLENELISAASHGYKLKNSGKMIFKHDIVLIEKKNTSKVSFKLQIKKDCIEEDLFNLKYKFFKSLKICFRKEENSNRDIQNKEESIFNLILYSDSVLYDFLTNDLLHSIDYVINLGKEALILNATLDSCSPYAYGERAKKCAIKYFKTANPEPKQCTKTNQLSEKRAQSETKTNQLQVQKEMANLMRASTVGVPCPQIIVTKGNVLMMSFIGKGRKPALKLKYAGLNTSSFVSAYKQVKDAMKRLYEKANLIHGELTEYNILWHNGQCYIIDFSQSIEPSHENAFYVLLRDCINITRFFGKRIRDVDPPEELFKFITGFYYGNKIVLEHMKQLYQRNPHVFHKPTDIDTASEEVKYQQEIT